MDPDADFESNVVLSAAAYQARDTVHSSHASRQSSPSPAAASRARKADNSSQVSRHSSPSPVILRISPAQGGVQYGYIHLSSGELCFQEAIQAYFDSAGRDVTTLPCPDFEGFLLMNSLRTCNISFLTDLPDYILCLGRQILEDNSYSSDGRPDLSWLPRLPSATSPFLLSLGSTRSANRSANVTT